MVSLEGYLGVEPSTCKNHCFAPFLTGRGVVLGAFAPAWKAGEEPILCNTPRFKASEVRPWDCARASFEFAPSVLNRLPTKDNLACKSRELNA
jgi:hypothetical protein